MAFSATDVAYSKSSSSNDAVTVLVIPCPEDCCSFHMQAPINSLNAPQSALRCNTVHRARRFGQLLSNPLTPQPLLWPSPPSFDRPRIHEKPCDSMTSERY